MTASIPRPEHPRPDFMRDTFINLNGEWQFQFDDLNQGIAQQWYLPGKNLSQTILVPFAYQTSMSGIGPTDDIHPILWYKRSFVFPPQMLGNHIRLCFGAVDFEAMVYVNGQLLGTHRGGYSPFSVDITSALKDGENEITVRVEDHPDCCQPRGKQYWKTGLMGCWYTPVSGIWQTVYLEAVEDIYLSRIHIMPDIDRHMFTADIMLNRIPETSLELRLTVLYDGNVIRTVSTSFQDRHLRIPVDMITESTLDPVHLWYPDSPALYDLTVELLNDAHLLDRVQTYFGMRKIEVKQGRVYLNNMPFYQRLILDQGYWPDSNITPPSDDAIQADIRAALSFGYNGARKHQKMEDPRYYYWADRLGFLVWGEVPSTYDYSPESVRNLTDLLADFIDRDFNHPSIICWVPLNESWGVRNIYTDPAQQAAARMLYQLTKALDGTRLCSSNDGWEQVETDICALHDYAAEGNVLSCHLDDRTRVEQQGCDMRPCYAHGVVPTGNEAFMVTEYGGIAMTCAGIQGKLSGMQTWGYHEKVEDEDAFFERFASVTNAIRALPFCQGYCYTQLTDVMQEINGLLTPDRKPKMDPERFKAINRNPEGFPG